MEPSKKYVVIYGVKGGREIKKNKSRDFLLIRSKKKVILYTKKGGFSGVELTVGGLEATDGRERLKMRVDSRVDDTFEKFGEEIEV